MLLAPTFALPAGRWARAASSNGSPPVDASRGFVAGLRLAPHQPDLRVAPEGAAWSRLQVDRRRGEYADQSLEVSPTTFKCLVRPRERPVSISPMRWVPLRAAAGSSCRTKPLCHSFRRETSRPGSLGGDGTRLGDRDGPITGHVAKVVDRVLPFADVGRYENA